MNKLNEKKYLISLKVHVTISNKKELERSQTGIYIVSFRNDSYDKFSLKYTLYYPIKFLQII